MPTASTRGLVVIERAGTRIAAALSAPQSIAIPLRFGGAQPSAFGLPGASVISSIGAAYGDPALIDQRFVCFGVNLHPHGNGTHTECVAHLTDRRITINDIVLEPLMVAALVSVVPEPLRVSREEYGRVASGDDLVISRRALEASFSSFTKGLAPHACVIRTLPNDAAKRSRAYLGTNPAYLTIDAVLFLLQIGIDHLLLDLPSADRERDNGILAAHRTFWDVPIGDRVSRGAPSLRTITELVFIDDAIPDGPYLLDLQLPPFVLDAAPSRPVLYPICSFQVSDNKR